MARRPPGHRCRDQADLVHPVPRSTNWFNVLGSALLTAFIFQVVTGIFLALSYVPAPNDAYQSLQYIVNDSVAGHFIRGVHYWGASAMILLIFAHTARVFLPARTSTLGN